MPATDKPRPHHYEFAHRALPAMAAGLGREIIDVALAGNLDVGLHSTWTMLGKRLSPGNRLPPDGLTGTGVSLEQSDLVVITFPPAERIAEAHFAAVVISRDQTAVRYFTLELSRGESGGIVTSIGEWADGRHVHHGTGPAPDLGAFVAALAELLGEDG